MGQKAHPTSLRLGYNIDWQSRWLDMKHYAKYLLEDDKIRNFLMEKFRQAGVSKIDIERIRGEIEINLHTARPGVVIGRGGAGIETLRKQIAKYTSSEVQINIHEVKSPETDAAIIASQIVTQIEKRIPFRRAIKSAIDNAMKSKVKGIKIAVAGRLNGAEIARNEKLGKGTIPLHTLRKKIDFSLRVARTTYGSIGVKVWVYKGEETLKDTKEQPSETMEAAK
jgi:small subunit ribosomal protein S3